MDVSEKATPALNLIIFYNKVLLFRWQMSCTYFLGVISYLPCHFSKIMSLDDAKVNNFNQVAVIVSLEDMDSNFDAVTYGILEHTINVMNIGMRFLEQQLIITQNCKPHLVYGIQR